jgi:hypothetical protein
VAHIDGQNFVAAKSLIENLDATFRIDGKVPELWFTETCKTEALSYSIVNGITTVKLQLPNTSL